MKIEIELTEIKRAPFDSPIVGADPDFPEDLTATRINYHVHIRGRRTIEFAILIPMPSGYTPSEDFLTGAVEAEFRRTLESAIRNDAIAARLAADLDESERKAIDALSRYKFQMFGYWAAIWVHLNRIKGDSQANPFRGFVRLAKRVMERS